MTGLFRKDRLKLHPPVAKVHPVFSSTIAYHSPGRLRLRHCLWREREALDAVIRAAGAIDGVDGLEPNPKAGSLVILYDPARLPPSGLLAKLAPLLGEGEAAAFEPRGAGLFALSALGPAANRAAKIGMLATTGLTVAALGFSRRTHAAAGWAGLAFLAVHLVHHRRKMWR